MQNRVYKLALYQETWRNRPRISLIRLGKNGKTKRITHGLPNVLALGREVGEVAEEMLWPCEDWEDGTNLCLPFPEQWACSYSVQTNFTSHERNDIQRIHINITNATQLTLHALASFAELFCHPRRFGRKGRIDLQRNYIEAIEEAGLFNPGDDLKPMPAIRSWGLDMSYSADGADLPSRCSADQLITFMEGLQRKAEQLAREGCTAWKGIAKTIFEEVLDVDGQIMCARVRNVPS